MTQKITITTTGLLIMLFACCFFANSLNAQVIYEEQFAGGIDSTWQNNPLSCGVLDSLHNTLWEWSDDGRAEMGAYWGDAGTIQSPSVGNGCALFSSDFLDNNGTAGNFYMGLSPAPHAAELVSPVIDCSAYPNISLEFYQSYRAFQSETRVEVSADSGATWQAIIINEGISGNASTDPGDIQLIDISEYVGGSNGVQFKFIFDGRYYFWLIDDVKLIVTPNNNLNLVRGAYPVLFGTPISQLPAVTELDAEVCNTGLLEQPNTSLACTINDSGGAQVFNSTFNRVDPFPVDNVLGEDSCETLIIPDVFDMAALGLGTDVYTLNYEVNSDSTNYLNSTTILQNFSITSNVIRKSPFDSNGGLTVSGGGAYEFGYQFFIQNDGDQAMSSSFMMAAQQGNTMEGEAATVKIYQIGADPLADEATTDDLILLGFGTYEFGSGYDNYDVASVDLFNLDDGEQGIEFIGGIYYLAMVSYSGNNTVFTAINTEVDYQFTNAIHDVSINGAGELFNGGFSGADRIPAIDIFIEPIPDPNSNEEVVTSFKTKLFPNPANQQIQLALDLEKVAKNLNVKITDAFGKVIENRNFHNIQNETITFDTNQYPTGSYLLYLRSDNKVQSQKFVIVH